MGRQEESGIRFESGAIDTLEDDIAMD